MKRVEGKPRKESGDPWSKIFSPNILERFETSAYHPLVIEFQDILKFEKDNGRAKLGLGLCCVATGKTGKGVSLLLDVKKEVPLDQAILRFLPSHYKIWMDIIEHLLARGEVELAGKLADHLMETWRPTGGRLLRQYNRIRKSITWVRNNGASWGRIWWSFALAPINFVRLTIFVLLLTGITFGGLYLGKNNIAASHLERARTNYFRGELMLTHLEVNGTGLSKTDMSKLTRVQQIKKRYPGDRNIAIRYFVQALEDIKQARELNPENIESDILELICCEKIVAIETSEANYHVFLNALKKSKQKFQHNPDLMNTLKSYREKYEDHRRKLLRGEAVSL